MVHVPVSDFVRSAAEDRAERVIREHDTQTTVPATFFEDLLAALDAPGTEMEEWVSGALDRALRSAAENEAVVVTGSFHTVGEAMEHLGMLPFPAK